MENKLRRNSGDDSEKLEVPKAEKDSYILCVFFLFFCKYTDDRL